jgi:hypothetical protein
MFTGLDFGCAVSRCINVIVCLRFMVSVD